MMNYPIVQVEEKRFLNCTGYKTNTSLNGERYDLPPCELIIEIQMHDAQGILPENVYFTIEKGKTELEMLQKHYPGIVLLVLHSLASSENIEGHAAVTPGMMSLAFLHLENDSEFPVEDLLHEKYLSHSASSL